MKNFILALLLLVLSIGLTVANAVKIRHDTDYLVAIAEQDDASLLYDELLRMDTYFSLTINHTVLEQAEQAAAEMRAYRYEEGEGALADYQSAKTRLLLALHELEEGEKFSFFNIF